MAGVGSQGVVDYTNTTSASATGVVATGDVGGATVVAYVNPAPPVSAYIQTLSGLNITTLSGAYIVTE